MTMIAYASSNIAGSQQQDGKKRIDGPPPQPTLPAVRHAILDSSLGYHRNDARTAENGFATSSGVSKSAKVMLGRVLIKS